MNTRQLGTDGPFLTVIGFGAWAIGGPWIYGWGRVDDEESIRAIHRAIDLGVNWIDTAAAYGFGHSEEIVAMALRGLSQDVFIATKCGLVPDGKGGVYRNSNPASMRREAEESLRRLRRDHIDLYQIHWPDVNVPYEESWGTMVRLREEGKVRFIGVSNYDVPMLERCATVAPVQSLQPPYSVFSRDVELETLPHCFRQGIGVVAYSPMQSGLLTGRFDMNKVAPDDWRRDFYMFQEPFLPKALQFVDQLRPVAARYSKTVGQLAVSWVLRHPSMTAAIVGARTTTQVEENVGAADFEISPSDMQLIGEMLQKQFFASNTE